MFCCLCYFGVAAESSNLSVLTHIITLHLNCQFENFFLFTLVPSANNKYNFKMLRDIKRQLSSNLNAYFQCNENSVGN